MSNKKQTNESKELPLYLDCAATTPLDAAVRTVLLRYYDEDYGNAGSRTHEYGIQAKHAVQKARDQVATLTECQREEVIFTSGATESNNLAILGLAAYGEKVGRKHIISTQIEHKAVLEPLEEMVRKGFEVTLLPPNRHGRIEPDRVKDALRNDTLLVTVMHANNETGTIQPVNEIAEILSGHDTFFHVDAAQTFGKILEELKNERVDLISASAHKLYGPKGVGALIARKRGFNRIPLSSLMHGGGQERGLRPGTVPVPLVAAFGEACEQALRHGKERNFACQELRLKALSALSPLDPIIHGDPRHSLPHIINLSIKGLDSEALMVLLKDLVAISNGSACTSSNYSLSHVLSAMEVSDQTIAGAVRMSWCHMTEEIPWQLIAERIMSLK